KSVPDAPDSSGMNREAHFPGGVLYGRHKLHIEGAAPFSFNCDPEWKADGKVVSEVGGLATCMSHEWQHKSDVSANGLRLRLRNHATYRQRSCGHYRPRRAR